MYYDTTNILKLIQLNDTNIDLDKSAINISNQSITVDLFLNYKRKCPICNSKDVIIKETRQRNISHPVLPNYSTNLIFHQRKLLCKNCGKYFMQDNPLCLPNKQISILGELKILDLLKDSRYSFKQVADLLCINEMAVVNCFDNHVDIKRHHLTKVICIDEFYARKLTDTKYCMTIFDPIENKILDILDARVQTTTFPYFNKLKKEEKEAVYYVNIDMYKPYKDIALSYFPNAKVCVDSFHVIEHINKAMDNIRLRVQKKFIDKNTQERSKDYYLLKTFHYYLKEDFDSIKYRHSNKSHFSYLYNKEEVLYAILSTSIELREAYELKEEYREFNKCGSYEEALIEIPNLISKFKNSSSFEFREIGGMLARWKNEIINSFIIVDGKRMSNGPIESLNSRIKIILKDAYGYTNFPRFRNRTMYSLNKNEILKLI